MNLIKVFSAAVLLIGICTHHVWAIEIQVGAPSTGGTDVFDVVKVPGGPTIQVPVPLLATDSATSKAKKVADKMLGKGIVATPTGNKVSLSAISVDLSTNKTGEKFKVLSPFPDKGTI